MPMMLGWRTYAAQIQNIVAERPDIDADFCLYQKSDVPIFRRLVHQRVPTLSGRKFLLHPIFGAVSWGRRWLKSKSGGEGYDAVHIGTQTIAGAFVDMLPKSMPLTVALDVTCRRPVRVVGSVFRQREVDEIEARVFERADRLFPFSDWAGGSLIEDFGVPREKVNVVLPSVNIPDHNALAAKPQSNGRRRRLVDIAFIGNPFGQKGGNDLLAAHQKVLSTIARLHIVSRDFVLGERMHNVQHYPFIPNDELLNQFLPRMDIFCLPTHADMSPFVVSEAASAGLPSVSTDTGAIPELCRDGETGYIVKPHDIWALAHRLRKLIENPALRLRQGQAALTLAQDRMNARINYNRVLDMTVQPA